MQRMIAGLALLLAMAIPILACASGSNGSGSSPKSARPRSLDVIHASSMSPAQATMIATLQGVLAKTEPRIYIVPSYASYSVWLADLQTTYGITTTTYTDAWSLLEKYKSHIKGYVLFQAGNNSINVATSLVGLFDAVAIEASLEGAAQSRGLPLVLDVRWSDEAWLRTHYGAQLRRDLVFEQDPTKRTALRDYAAMTGAMTFYGGDRAGVFAGLDPDSSVLGWGNTDSGEKAMITPVTQAGLFMIPSDFCYDLSVFSSLREDALRQSHAEPIFEGNVHYVTFVPTDGDNLQWILGDFSGPQWFGNANRGRFDMGWAVPPSMIDLAPSVLRWFYAQARDGVARTSFVAGPSGRGYMYPSQYPPAALDRHVQRLNEAMGRADLHLVQIIDTNAFENVSLWDKYTAQPNIDGLIYVEYSPYDGAGGAIRWSSGKPVASVRKKLWAGAAGSDEASVISAINNAPRDPTRAEGYTLVAAHVWSKTLDSVQTVVNGLRPDVRVVTPEAFFKLIAAGIPHARPTPSR